MALDHPLDFYSDALHFDRAGRSRGWGYHQETSIGMAVDRAERVRVWDAEDTSREREFDVSDADPQEFLDELDDFLVGRR